jgi:hypothetical protein
MILFKGIEHWQELVAENQPQANSLTITQVAHSGPCIEANQQQERMYKP